MSEPTPRIEGLLTVQTLPNDRDNKVVKLPFRLYLEENDGTTDTYRVQSVLIIEPDGKFDVQGDWSNGITFLSTVFVSKQPMFESLKKDISSKFLHSCPFFYDLNEALDFCYDNFFIVTADWFKKVSDDFKNRGDIYDIAICDALGVPEHVTLEEMNEQRKSVPDFSRRYTLDMNVIDESGNKVGSKHTDLYLPVQNDWMFQIK